MIKKNKKQISCFECKHSQWKYYDDMPIVQYLYCQLNHEETSHKAHNPDKFFCADYQHSYFVKAYFGMWFFILFIVIICLLILIISI